MASLQKESSAINVERLPVRTFILDYAYSGQSRQVKQQIVEMALNGSGVRDTARVLHVSPSTVIQELKKGSQIQQVNLKALKQLMREQIEVEICLAEVLKEAEGRNLS
jgi:DNA invertase Pin-like site-specific DNA recombinase